jgi:hypothetical protein
LRGLLARGPGEAGVAGAVLHGPSVDGDAFAHPEQAEAARRGGQVTAGTDFDLDSRLANLGHQVAEAAKPGCGASEGSPSLSRSRPRRRQSSARPAKFLPSRRFLPGSQSAVSIATRVPSGFTSPTGTLTSRMPFS